jgi:cation transport ATPase/YHS domain-containing protein
VAGDRKIPAHCPTCNKVVDKLRAESVGIFSGKILYFCSKGCKDLFAKSGPSRSIPSLRIEEPAGPDGLEPPGSPADSHGPAIDLSDALMEEMAVPGGGEDELAGEVEEPLEESRKRKLPSLEEPGVKTKLKISYWSITLIFITVQILVVGVSCLFMNLRLMGHTARWIALPLAAGVAFQFLQAVKSWKRGGSGIALDEMLVLLSIVIFFIPYAHTALGGSGASGPALAVLLVPSGILVLVWAGRFLEEIADRKLAESVELGSLYEDETIRKFVGEKGRERSTLSRLSSVMADAMVILSPVAAACVVLWHLLFGGTGFFDRRMWAFASAVSISCCPRLFRNNIITSYFMGMLNGRRRGIRFLHESGFEKAGMVDAVVFRKRGGVADPETRVVEMIRTGSIMEESLLSLCLSCEEGIRENETASAVIRFASRRNVAAADIRLKRYWPSRGVHCTSPYGEIIIGSRSFLVENGISLAKAEEAARERERRGESVVFLSVDRKVQALFVLSNDIRSTAASICGRLHKAGITPTIISGDSNRTLESIADKIGLEQVRAEIPFSKWPAELERIRDTGHRIAIVGSWPFKDKTSILEDLVIEVRAEGEAPDGQSLEPGVILGDENLERVADTIEIARRSRRTILVSSAAALLVQIFAAGIALSGLVSPLTMGGLVNITAGLLWFIHPTMAQKEPPGL